MCIVAVSFFEDATVSFLILVANCMVCVRILAGALSTLGLFTFKEISILQMVGTNY